MIKESNNLNIEDFDYPLPTEKIAQKPLIKRDISKLLIADNSIRTDIFENISDYLPNNSMIVFNDTKVIRARLVFYKETGARIEVFLLEPYHPTKEISFAFQQKKEVIWKAYVGNAKKWKKGSLYIQFEHNSKTFNLEVEKLNAIEDSLLVKLKWELELSFSEVLEKVGKIPLPPYMKRKSNDDDAIRYQTVYAENEGSVAAPTAGLHFTEKVFNKLESKNIKKEFISLHVGAGTFKPVSSSSVADHEMHIEKILIKKSFIQNLLAHLPKKIIAVGTTSSRSLESMYWFGVQLIKDPNISEFDIKQWDPYKLADFAENIELRESLKAILNYLERNNLNVLKGQTQLMIIPKYKFKIIDKLITNFHQPKSTLLLLVSAFYGDKWKQAYDYALENDFRFLSYGDSCLFSKEE